MHQPYYKDDFENKYFLPWVFLHGIKDYLDMPWYVSNFENIKAVFNLVPSLLVQLEDYANGTANDIFLNLISKKTSELTKDEKQSIIPMLFMANKQNMIYPSQRYGFLYEKYNNNQELTNEETEDVEVLFLLAWTGNFVRKKSKYISNLIKQDKNFTFEQKSKLLKELYTFLKEIIPFYKRFAKENKIEISTTPYYHPILPLLLNPLSAKEAKKNIILPNNIIQLKEDAYLQVANSIEYFNETFGLKPYGMWPAEGSISNEAVNCFAENDVKWIASDEDVLSNSLSVDLKNENFRNQLYNAYYMEYADRKINIFFRDKKLSDLIGFSYANLDYEQASSDFILKLKTIYENCDFEPVVSVILDGENAWEYYPNNAYNFFKSLYKKISESGWIKTCSFSDIINENKGKKLENIVAGSWIYGNFTTWVGHEEKNKAWELLYKTLNDTKNNYNNLNEDKKQLMKKELHIAQGSDWFWWYGDDHFSTQSDIFDMLFRKHLENIYKITDTQTNPEIYKPIKNIFKTGNIEDFKCYIKPKIDGKLSSFFEWKGSGIFDLKYDLGAMHTDSSYMQKLFWGIDKECLYLRIDGEINKLSNKNFILNIKFAENKNLFISMDNGKVLPHSDFLNKKYVKFAMQDIIEISIPLNEILTDNKILLKFEIMENQEILEHAPVFNFAELIVSDNHLENWIV